jgi:hypothetical protein
MSKKVIPEIAVVGIDIGKTTFQAIWRFGLPGAREPW